MKLNSIIIVDDDPMVCQGLSVILPWEEYGFRIRRTYSNAADALSALEENPADLVITDIKMPGMNGVELIEEIRRRKIASQVLILSGYDDYEYLKKAITLNVVSYLMKPINPEELISNLETVNSRIDRIADNRIFREGLEALKNTVFQRVLNRQIDRSELLNKLDFLQMDDLLLWRSYQPAIFSSDKPVQPYIRRLEGEGHIILFYDAEQKLVLLGESRSEIESLLPKTLTDELSLFFGEPVHDLSELSISYNDAWKQLIQEKAPVDGIRLVELIVSRDIEPLRQILLELTEEENLQLAKEKLFSSLMLIQEELKKDKQLKRDIQELIGLSYRFFSSASSRELLMEKVESLCRTLSLLWENAAQLTGNLAVDRVIAIIQQNPGQSTSLSIIANELDMNPSYLGKLFFETTGTKFTSYVKELRIEMACRHLRDTDMKISEIAEKCGFNDMQYFLKVFSSYKDCTPTVYKKSIYT
ncbi:MAG: response regulator [Spirochaetales bacterium]|nr:response regulator [Spirochaetales bacterium]